MNTTLLTGSGAPLANSQRRESRDPNRLTERHPSEGQVSLRRALRTLSAIRQRYEVGRIAHPDARFYSVHVVVDHGDVAWITATIEALEKTFATVATDPAAPVVQARPET
jgi:hypothetical protein